MIAKLNVGYFLKLFLKIALLITFIIIALTLFLYSNFKSFSIDLLNSSQEKINTQVFVNALQIHDSIRNHTSALFNHTATVELMYGHDISVLDTINHLRDLDMLINSLPQLHSAYVYNGQKETMFTVGSDIITSDSANFFDQELIHLLEDNTSWVGMQPIPRRINIGYQTNRSIPVFTYITAEFTNDRKSILGALIVNVHVDAIFTTVNSHDKTNALDENDIIILNENGTVLGHPVQEKFLSNLADKHYIQEIIQSKSDSGYFVAQVEQEDSVISYSTNKSIGWTMVSITPLKYISGTINKVKTITLIIGIFMIVICILTAFLLSKNIYNPIGNLRKRAQNFMGSNTSEQDDFKYISHSLTEAEQRLHSLQNFKRTNLHALKQNFLKALLDHSAPSDYEQKFNEYQFIIDPKSSMILILARIDHYSEFCTKYHEKEQVLIKYALMNIAEEIMQGGAYVDIGEDQIILFMNYEEDSGLQLDEKIKQFQTSSKKFLTLSISMFVSNIVNNIREINELHKEVSALSKNRIKAGHGCILHAAHTGEESVYKLDPALLSKLTTSVHQGRYEVMNDVFQELISPLRLTAYNEIMYTLSSITTTIFQSLSTLEKNTTVSFELDFVEFDKKIKSLETLDEIDDAFKQLFLIIVDVIEKNKNKRSAKLVENVEQYIAQEYENPAISTKLIADYFNVSTAYLGKLFKEQASVSIAEYITQVRLKKASELLRETSLTVDEIIDHVGWENKKYFFTVFKKHYGATPTEFRLKSKY